MCKNSLADKPFVTKESELFCPDCYDERFSPRCDGCKKIFKAGSRKYEYKGSTWHEECFTCLECKQPLGTKSFVPKDEGVVCVPCYEEKYSQKCFKCGKVSLFMHLMIKKLLLYFLSSKCVCIQWYSKLSKRQMGGKKQFLKQVVANMRRRKVITANVWPI